MERVRILLVDDHPLLRQGLRMVLDLEPDFTVVGETGDGEKALSLVKELGAQVVLMDINLPGMSGIETTRLLKEEHPDIKILALTIHDDDEYVIQMIQAGASGYLLKDVEPSGLVRAIRAAVRGKSYISPGITGKVFGVLTRLAQERYITKDQVLTQREFEVLQLIAQGCSNQKIAQDLVISEKTVKNHVSSILRKLDVRDRTQAAVYALKYKMVNF